MSRKETILAKSKEEGIPDFMVGHLSLPTNVGILGRREECIEPSNAIGDTGSIHFRVTSSANEVIDVNATTMTTKFRVVAADGALLPDDLAQVAARMAVVNGMHSAMIKNMAIRFNNLLITTADNMYHYRAHLETQLYNDINVKRGKLKSILWDADYKSFDERPVNYNGFAAAVDAVWPADAEHLGNAPEPEGPFRGRWQGGSRIFRTEGPIFSDITNQEKLLPPNSKLEFIIDRNPHQLCLLSKVVANANQKVIVESMRLNVTYVRLEPEIILQQEKMTLREPFRFPIVRTKMQFFAKNAGLADWSQPNLLTGLGDIIPRRIYVAFVRLDAYNGDVGLDPFNYQLFEIGEVTLRVDGQVEPFVQLYMQRNGDAHDVIMPFQSLMKTTHRDANNASDLGIDIHNYNPGNAIMGFDLTPSGMEPGLNYELPRKARSLNLTVRLNANAAHNAMMIVMLEYDAEITRDADEVVRKFDHAIENPKLRETQ